MDWSWLIGDWSTQLEMFALVLIAAVLAGVIGVEREFAGKPAGLRTHMFVGAGAAMFMLIGQALIHDYSNTASVDVVRSDPVRIMQAIVVGISFLGAGTIIHHGQDKVEGLTTAASIWLVAAIGIAVATQRIVLAVCVTITAVLLLTVLGIVARKNIEPLDGPDER